MAIKNLLLSLFKNIVRPIFHLFGFDLVRYVGTVSDRDSYRSGQYKDLKHFSTSTGEYYLPDLNEDNIINAIKSDLIFDEPIYNLSKRFIREGTVVLDIGSNFGQMAILFSKHIGNGEVHAFEANDFVYSVLCRNIEANSKCIIPHFGAVHDESNTLLYFPETDLQRFTSFGSYGIDYVHHKGRPVSTIVIDEIKFDREISFVKIDVQGGDLHVLRGMRNTIMKHRMPIIFEYEYLFEDDLKLSFQEYVDFVKNINYRFEKVIMGQNYLILPEEAPE